MKILSHTALLLAVALVAALAVASVSALAFAETTDPAGVANSAGPVDSRSGDARAPVYKAPRRVSLGTRAVRIARRELGVPYVWGGESPSGFDCSGLVRYVYGRLGFDLPHNAASLYGVGRPVPTSRLRPGDLVFFDGLGHVGIYAGRGRMIHAPQSGDQVSVATIFRDFGNRLIGARRVGRA